MAARSDANLPAYQAQPRLARVAMAHAVRMARSGSIWHNDLASWANGKSAAQNVATGQSGTDAFQLMWNSPPHHQALVSRKYRLMGVGAAVACDGSVMVAVDLTSAR
ncbi:MAG: CAP domain-containing protein [Thermoleophilia bacterium]